MSNPRKNNKYNHYANMYWQSRNSEFVQSELAYMFIFIRIILVFFSRFCAKAFGRCLHFFELATFSCIVEIKLCIEQAHHEMTKFENESQTFRNELLLHGGMHLDAMMMMRSNIWNENFHEIFVHCKHITRLWKVVHTMERADVWIQSRGNYLVLL